MADGSQQPLAISHQLSAMGGKPDFVAGHSLGQYTALVAANALTFADALRLVRERGRLMKETGEQTPGGMAAILGLDDATVEALCQEVNEGARDKGQGLSNSKLETRNSKLSAVTVANYNSSGQIVISGEKAALERAIALAKERGARRVIPLAVSIASHSALMQAITPAFAQAVAQTEFRPTEIPLVANGSAQPITAVEDIRAELVRHLTTPVQWTRSVEYMIAQGVTTFVEVGPGTVLAGLIKRISKEVEVMSVGDQGIR
jgi:[acyl-carrier-protein] S-malonyltransferase